MVARIALVGGENASYPSHRALKVARGLLGEGVQADWAPTGGPAVHDLSRFHGIWLVPGSPYADDQAAYAAVRWARVHDVPFLGTCGGLQYAVAEYVRNVLGVSGASHAESDGISGSNVIGVLACSLQERMQGTTRLRADLRLKQGQHEEAFGRQLEHLGLRIIGDGSI